MREIIEITCVITGIIIGFYVIGRLFGKGLLKELDIFLNKKFTDYINNKKKKEDENKTHE